ncbi:reticulon-like protein B22 isoform X2 [Dendrobium catenatum]|uniref:reticulon-like protein B22 isoform X2 n=1 Tax=Dendrobium catenatum TaxID=906689 RepID=UPI0010A0867C|nr:reticulon-like protein B22 isoform X2 [Dendrobium catenatum]
MDEVAAVSKGGLELGRPAVVLLCGSLVYYHCAYRDSSLLSLFSDVLIVLLCSLAILGMLFRQMNISVPVDPLEWQLSQDTSNSLAACLANTIGAAESVLRVAATGHDKRLFLKEILEKESSNSAKIKPKLQLKFLGPIEPCSRKRKVEGKG